MPGARLSPQDRLAIATGLAEGLDYAAIARLIARPTSTVTREIARNGGPGRYRAETAQRATARRARRRPGLARPAQGAAAAPDGRDRAAIADYADRFADLLVHLGLPRMVARVLSCLYVTDSGSLSAADLVQRLGVSPASVSKAVGYLADQGLIRRERDGRHGRREQYTINGDVWYRSLLASAQRNALLAEFARTGADLLGADTPAGQRLDTAADFLAEIGADLVRAVERRRSATGMS
ncbi:MarR family transcriptional regulator [Kitasatospora sp. NPDC028055]|uniref:GbsR/MarR family transcriptional regulator n=1 Tax=Kitasatospora sp. NPDC028055 TaxID=3155653 RepID=UPI0033FFD8B3